MCSIKRIDFGLQGGVKGYKYVPVRRHHYDLNKEERECDSEASIFWFSSLLL